MRFLTLNFFGVNDAIRFAESIDDAIQADTIDKLHHEKTVTVLLTVSKHWHDITMPQLRRRPRFMLKPRDPFGDDGNSPWQNLYGHEMSGLQIPGLKHDAHAAPAEFADEFAVADPRKRKSVRHVAPDGLRFFGDARVFQHREYREHVTNPCGVRREPARVEFHRRLLAMPQFIHKLGDQQLKGFPRAQGVRIIVDGQAQQLKFCVFIVCG